MANKWRVSYGNCVLGHYAAKTPEEAVTKAVDRCIAYHPEVSEGIFNVTKAGNAANVVFTVMR